MWGGFDPFCPCVTMFHHGEETRVSLSMSLR